MCGIFAYAGVEPAGPQVFAGLRRLAYRGYDSWGVVEAVAGKLKWEKAVGHVPDLATEPHFAPSTIGLGHTRWATHGGVTPENAHPHLASDQMFALVHNGIVENAEELKLDLKKAGYSFVSQTDSEVLVRQIEKFYAQDKDLSSAIRLTALKAQGRNTFAVLTDKGDLYAVRNGSPLVLGRDKKKNTIFISSDSLSLGTDCSELFVVENNQLVEVTKKQIRVRSVESGESTPFAFAKISNSQQELGKEGFTHYMLKEIHESAQALHAVIAQPMEELNDLSDQVRRAGTVYTIGSGTAGIAAAQIAYYLRVIANVNAISLVGAESQSYWNLFKADDLIIAPSQSGETADVLEVLEIAREKKVKIASYVNMAGSMMTRLSDYPFMAGAGPEVCVLSTKIFLSQIGWGLLVAHAVAQKYDEGLALIRDAATAISSLLQDDEVLQGLKQLASKLKQSESIFVFGKGQLKEVASEGMVKIIEGSYVHAHAIPAGDLKHYAITLMQPGVPVLALTARDEALKDISSAAHQVSARGATVYSLGSITLSASEKHIKVPEAGLASGLVTVVPLQLLAYYLAVKKGNPVDTPRNIAKSVTVK